MCRVSFWILFIWVCLIISITLDLVLRQFRFSLRSFNLNSRFFFFDYVKAVLYYFNFNQIVQFNIIILCKYPKVNMHILHTVLDITSMITDRIGLHEVLLPINYKKYKRREV